MAGEGNWRTTIALVPPMAAPLNQNAEKEDEQWSSNFNNSVNAVYMGFVATAILISMFLVMAIFERFFRRPRTTSQLTTTARNCFAYNNNPKLDHNSSKVSLNFLLKIGLQILIFFFHLFLCLLICSPTDYLRSLTPSLREDHCFINNPKAGKIIHQSSSLNRYRTWPHGIILGINVPFEFAYALILKSLICFVIINSSFS